MNSGDPAARAGVERNRAGDAQPDLKTNPVARDNRAMISRTISSTAVKAVIFDCDGTLVDSETSGMTALYEEACKLGYSLSLERALEDFRGNRMAVCIAHVESNLGHAAPEGFEATVRQAMAEKFRSSVTAMPGAVALLQQLADCAIPYCIASNGPMEKMDLTLGLTGLQGYFKKHIFSAYELGHWKPSPRLFLHAAKQMGVAPAHCAVIEDSLPGIAAGLAANMRVYSMCDPATIPADVASRIVQINGLTDLVGELGLGKR